MCTKYFGGVPTVHPAPNFNAADDAEILRGAMDGLGTDEDMIIEILTQRSNQQRQAISEHFKNVLERDLIDDIKGELGGDFEKVMVALLTPHYEYLCKELKNAMNGAGTNESTLVEIICSKANEEIDKINECYERLYERPLVEHVCSETSGNLGRFLTLILTKSRNDCNDIDDGEARAKAEELYAGGEGQLGTEESVFYKVLAHESFAQLRRIFEEYKEISGNTIEQALKHELSGDYLEALLAVVECVQSPAIFFARKLHDSMEGMGTDDDTLIRIIVSRSEIDLGTIKQEFEKMYDKTLESCIENDASGDYKRALLALVH
ncbi:annexin B10 isoform X2 [Harmonia axyridis]|uniref:annexin B10 isoform X2 n=1 Tax=Harmonia axyridis TaxID=115357 RepID=UPI001E277076|nr:annexin B10 isoform X2 [Harmonia axyridis]XP_045464211.1 annexin B10 isoform X2 [Harmonia axyridis]